ncbi:DnaJ domain-containing protein [Aureimonas populi]|uniref:DnaJ domain-containing protein n=1 Tax=Aureimonas populi TaxID=1701758 RepID=A0ABW5CP65_9HYPH|nr:DnaJ domain-containing protein [Aureimonas populi]
MMALGALAALVFLLAVLRIVMVTPPERLARLLRAAGPIVLMLAGGGLALTGRAAIGIPVLGLGLAAWRRRRPPAAIGGASSSARSTVRAAHLEMSLDHDSGDLDGKVLAGPFAAAWLSELSDTQLHALRGDMRDDAESLRLLEAYLDRRAPGWRDDAQTGDGDGLGGAPGAGPMTEQQAHEILGLQPGATTAEIREAHRRLMKRVHPDHGGTDFLAARINEAKAFLIDRHR